VPKRQSSWDSEGGSLVDKRSSRRTSPRRARLRRATARSLPRELDHEGHRELKVLEAISENERTTQRTVAAQLGIALGLANLYIRRLVRKGYIKAVSIPSNRVLYLITPKGIAEKTRLTFKYMEYSLQVFRRARMHLKTMLEPYAGDATRRIAIYGTGEAAELAYLCLRELAIEPTAVLDDDGSGRFFNLPVQAIGSVDEAEFDLVVVATLDDPSACVQLLISRGIPARKLVTLRGPVPDAGGGQAARPVGSGNGQP
jgi:DNA-binding MarR family transcriptional regulator